MLFISFKRSYCSYHRMQQVDNLNKIIEAMEKSNKDNQGISSADWLAAIHHVSLKSGNYTKYMMRVEGFMTT